MIRMTTIALAHLLLVPALLVAGDPAQAVSLLIQDVVIIDGSGAARMAGSVRVVDGRIAELGDLEPEPGETVVAGEGLVLAPGFIDTHTHAGGDIETHREALAAVSQGITTAVAGQDGSSPLPLANWLAAREATPPAINFAAYSGHNSLREEVLGENSRRHATAGEIEAMSSLLQRDLEAGAMGLSTGLEYEPGIWSDPAEVIALAKVAAAHGGRYSSHVRSEDRWFWQAVEEIIEIGRQTGMPVHISHLKLAMKSHWGKANTLVEKLDSARAEGIDITADIYPYTYWQSTLMVLVPSRDITDRPEFEFALAQIAPPEGLWFTRFDPQPEYVGTTLTDISKQRERDPVTTLMQLAAESEAMRLATGDGVARIIGTSMTEADVQALMLWPHSNICSDGGLDDLHPRGAGTYPRVLGRYVRDQGLMSLETAVHKMTGLAARHAGITDRGMIKVGMAADLVLFDPDIVIDHATPQDPGALSSGITTVWVNGEQVFDRGAATGRFPGQVLRRNAP